MKDLTSLATYLAYNPLFRDEMLKKHGMTLGYRGLERSPDFAGAGHWMSGRNLTRPSDRLRRLLADATAAAMG